MAGWAAGPYLYEVEEASTMGRTGWFWISATYPALLRPDVHTRTQTQTQIRARPVTVIMMK